MVHFICGNSRARKAVISSFRVMNGQPEYMEKKQWNRRPAHHFRWRRANIVVTKYNEPHAQPARDALLSTLNPAAATHSEGDLDDHPTQFDPCHGRACRRPHG